MPTYGYACTACGHHVEAVQSFSDEPLTTCQSCGGSLRKVFGSVGIVLKGSGFYRTDNRSGARNGSDGSGSEAASGDASGSASGSNGKKEPSPASTGTSTGTTAPAPSAASGATTS